MAASVERPTGSVNNTIAHECIHRHRKARQLIAAQRQDAPDAPLVDLLEPVITQLAKIFEVSRQAAKIRLLNVGYEEARGVLDY